MSETALHQPDLTCGAAVRGSWASSTFEPSPTDIDALIAMVKPVTLAAGSILHASGDPVPHVYLLGSAVVALSLSLRTADASGVQLLSSGDIVGLNPVFTGHVDNTAATVLVGGTAARAQLTAFRGLCQERPGLAFALGGLLAAQVRNLQGGLFCRAHHSVEARLADLLLDAARRLGTERVPITQEQLALVLGVQRTTISTLASRLKAAGIIGYLRGTVRIPDPLRLAAVACNCASDEASESRWLSQLVFRTYRAVD